MVLFYIFVEDILNYCFGLVYLHRVIVIVAIFSVQFQLLDNILMSYYIVLLLLLYVSKQSVTIYIFSLFFV